MVESQNRAILGFTSTPEKTVESAAAKFTNQPGLRVIQRTPTRSNGLPAMLVIGEGQMEKGQMVRLMVYYVEYRGAVYQFLGYSAPQAFSMFQREFMQTMQGFAELQDSRVVNKEPVRLGLERTMRAARFQDLIAKNLPTPFTPEDLAIMNQVQLNEEIRPGTTIKVPRPR
jgi:predicted Zn-dependent protease